MYKLQKKNLFSVGIRVRIVPQKYALLSIKGE